MEASITGHISNGLPAPGRAEKGSKHAYLNAANKKMTQKSQKKIVSQATNLSL